MYKPAPTRRSLTVRGAGGSLFPMDPISGLGSNPPPQPINVSDSADDGASADGAQSANGADSGKNISLLKKSHDLAKDTAARLLELIPPPRSPNPPGVGGKIDLTA